MKKLVFTGYLILLASGNYAQKLITADEAIGIALKNNFGILISGNNAEINSLNNTPGNAGMLPAVAVTGSDNISINNTYQKQSGGSETTLSNINSNVMNAAVELNWTLFDGGKMFVTKSKLKEMEILGQLQYKETVLQVIYNVTVAYFNVVKQKQQLASIQNAILYNKERVKIYQTSFDAGLSPKTNLLQAKIDLNVNLENAISQQYIIEAAKRELNVLLGRKIDSLAYDVTDTIPLYFKPNKEEILNKIYEKNISLQIYEKQLYINSLSIKEINATRLPKINFNAGFDFMQMSNNKGNVLVNRNYGPQIGASVIIPLFQGGNINRQVSVARMQLNSAQLAFDFAKIETYTELQNALTDFENQQELLNIENENAELAKENLDISMHRLRLGQTTSLEVRQAQDSYEKSLTRLINFKFNLKVAETKLKQLISEL